MKKIKTLSFLCFLVLFLMSARPKSTIHPIIIFNIMMGISFVVIIALWIIVIYRRKKQK